MPNNFVGDIIISRSVHITPRNSSLGTESFKTVIIDMPHHSTSSALRLHKEAEVYGINDINQYSTDTTVFYSDGECDLKESIFD